MAKKTWAEQWGESPVDYTRPQEQLAKELKKIRNLTARRASALKKKNAFSYAEYQYEQSMQRTYMFGKQPNVDQMSYKDIERELRIHHQFWASKTSSIKGAKEEQYNQSSRIFGSDKRGRPLRNLTLEEGREFWKAYEEFYNQYKEGTSKFDSTRIQQIVGQAMVQKDFRNIDLIKLLQEVKLVADEDYENPFETSIDIARRMEVLHGYGNDF